MENKNNQFWGIKHLPNAITCLNLFSGCAGAWLAFNGNFLGATVAILLSGMFDFLDGMVARLVHSYSDIGKELDSLADVVSFGVVPGAIVFSMLSIDGVHTYSFLAFVIPIFSALRLAKFNIDTRQTTSFIGFPTPANAILWGGLSVSFSEWFIQNPIILLGFVLLLSYLLVAEIPMFSLKFKSLSWEKNKLQYVFLAGGLLLVVLLRVDSIAPIIVWYILLSIGNFLASKFSKKGVK